MPYIPHSGHLPVGTMQAAVLEKELANVPQGLFRHKIGSLSGKLSVARVRF